eukprot:2113683-Prymnesium_polylepis.1
MNTPAKPIPRYRVPRTSGYIAFCRICIPCVPTTHAASATAPTDICNIWGQGRVRVSVGGRVGGCGCGVGAVW